MRYTKSLLVSLRETPAEATLRSHILMLRAGLIRKVSSGLYSYMPTGLRTLQKIKKIVREEMDAIGCAEVLMPVLVPEELLQQSGRWKEFSKELYSLSDRSNTNYALSPTNEENFAKLASSTLESHRQFPLSLYQINHKFRDEIRPRYGVMRAKEFIMKDAYSFHLSDACLQKTYDAMRTAYKKIFIRLGLNVVHVKAASGTMGGKVSEEFMLPSKVGEETIIKCSKCHYVANQETAKVHIAKSSESSAKNFEESEQPINESSLALHAGSDHKASKESITQIHTPNANTIDEVCSLLGCNKQQTIKTMVYTATPENHNPADEQNNYPHYIVAIIRGDYDVNEYKLSNAIAKQLGVGHLNLQAATEEEIETIFNCKPGYLSPIAMPVFNSVYANSKKLPFITKRLSIYCDISLKGANEMVAGANKINYHFAGIDVQRDIAMQYFSSHQTHKDELENYAASTKKNSDENSNPVPFYYHDFILAKLGDACIECGGKLQTFKGIELGHIFQLGKRYTHAFKHSVASEDGKKITPTMGCYGIGISRIIAAIVEEKNDENGICFPAQVAPFFVSLLLLNSNEPSMREGCDKIYTQFLENGIEILYDDRDERPGSKFKDADLLGCPYQIIYSQRNVEKSEVEIKNRQTGERTSCSIANLLSTFKKLQQESA